MKYPVLIITLLAGLCLHPFVYAQQLSGSRLEEKRQIIQAVLESELNRESRVYNEPRTRFEADPELSSENISPLTSFMVSGRKIVALDAAKIREKLVGGTSLTYLIFKSFEPESNKVLVTISRVTEQDRCFGGHYQESIDRVYLMAKVANNWKAEWSESSVPQFGSWHPPYPSNIWLVKTLEPGPVRHRRKTRHRRVHRKTLRRRRIGHSMTRGRLIRSFTKRRSSKVVKRYS